MGKTLQILFAIIILSFGKVDMYNEGKEEWLKDAFSTIRSDSDIKAISYWNKNWEDEKPVKMVINSSKKAQSIYRHNVSSAYFVSKANIKNGKSP